MKLSPGLVHVITGSGKGKTTSAMGLALRASGHGLKVCVVQFLKGTWRGGSTGEAIAAKGIPNITFVQFGKEGYVYRRRPHPIDYELAHKGLEYAREAVNGGGFDLVILDEINVALHDGLVQLKDVLDLVNGRPEHVELVLTGRHASEELCKLADYVTEVRSIKHPYEQGQQARRGIEW